MKKKILVIDDDYTICEIVETILKDEGYDIRTLPNGDMLSMTLKTFEPDLIIVDYLMPGLNGADLTTYFRTLPKTKSKPIIMIAANPHYKMNAKKAGVNLFLNKPFDIYELIYSVNTLIDTQEADYNLSQKINAKNTRH